MSQRAGHAQVAVGHGVSGAELFQGLEHHALEGHQCGEYGIGVQEVCQG